MFRQCYLTNLLLLTLLVSCKQASKPVANGKDLAEHYCGTCHRYPEPSLLDSGNWMSRVFPAMAPKVGLKYFFGDVFQDVETVARNINAGITSVTISPEDWKLIQAFYRKNSPALMPSQSRPPIQSFETPFVVKPAPFHGNGFPITTYLHIDEQRQRIYAAQGYDSALLTFDKNLHLLSSNHEHGIIVDVAWDSQKNGQSAGWVVNIGNMHPNDQHSGSIRAFNSPPNGSFQFGNIVAENLPRPVQVVSADLDQDGLKDWLVCGFGDHQGELFWLKNRGTEKPEKKLLLSLPGAIRAIVRDANGDGRPDIWVLMAQAEEGIYLFLNQGGGEFLGKELLRFPPIYGSSYFEFADFNNDGHPDILYTCGDNADFTTGVLKPYHGVYIFMNDGKNQFTQKWFFPIHGCYKAMARDFDGDGDLDIAAISYFPDTEHQPQEGFVYLQNEGNLQFKASTIPQYHAGKWLTMDAGDVDGDGDIDLVIGCLAVNNSRGNAVKETDQKLDISFLLLENKTARKKK